jgi:hypothetical protein
MVWSISTHEGRELFRSKQFTVGKQDKRRPEIVIDLSECTMRERRSIKSAILKKHPNMATKAKIKRKLLYVTVKKEYKKRLDTVSFRISQTAWYTYEEIARSAQLFHQATRGKITPAERCKAQRRRHRQYAVSPPYAQLSPS